MLWKYIKNVEQLCLLASTQMEVNISLGYFLNLSYKMMPYVLHLKYNLVYCMRKNNYFVVFGLRMNWGAITSYIIRVDSDRFT